MFEQSVKIHDLSHDGRGVARLPSGKTCFIAGALPGETVRFKILKSKRSFDEAVCLEVIAASPGREEPRCEYYANCGGCELQHMTTEMQLDWKQRQLQTTFEKARLVVDSWMPPLDAGGWNYRRRTRLAVVFDKAGTVTIGYRARASKRIVNIGQCEVLDQQLNALIPELQALAPMLKSNGLSELELSSGDQEQAVCFNLRSALTAEQINLIQQRLGKVQLWQKLPGEPAMPVTGSGILTAGIVYDIQLGFCPGQFVQINSAVNRAMVEQAIDWLNPQLDQDLLDLFCGAGNFGLAFSPRVKAVLGAEGSDKLCDQARTNAELNGLHNLEFKTVNLFEPGQFSRLGKEQFDLVILDPPRAGASELMPWLAKQGPEKVLYISCHPATMVRDIQLLSQDYRIEKVGAMNMFPHTTHLEAMTLLVKR